MKSFKQFIAKYLPGADVTDSVSRDQDQHQRLRQRTVAAVHSPVNQFAPA
jgi:hypothetical protein